MLLRLFPVVQAVGFFLAIGKREDHEKDEEEGEADEEAKEPSSSCGSCEIEGPSQGGNFLRNPRPGVLLAEIK